jgi:hypothetical protein
MKITLAMPASLETTAYNSSWDANRTLTISQHRHFGWYVEGTSALDDTTSQNKRVAAEQRLLSCQVYSKQYKLNVSYVNGVQNTAYSTEDAQPLLAKATMIVNDTDAFRPSTDPAVLGNRTPAWHEEMKATFEDWNSFAIVESLLMNMDYS